MSCAVPDKDCAVLHALPERRKPLLFCYQPELDVLPARQDVGLCSLALPRPAYTFWQV